MKSYDDIKLNIIVPVSSAGVLDVYDISDETKLRIIVENAGVLNTVIVSGRIIGQTGFTELKTVVGSSNTLVNISSYDHIKIECTVYESLNSSPIKVIAASFSNAGGSAIESIDVPSGDDLADVDKLIFSSSDGSVIITGNSTTNTVDFTVDPSVGAVTSVNTQTGDVVLTKSDLGLSDVDNTSDINKPISTATQTALNGKEPLITGGTTSQYWRGDKSWQTLDKSSVGLSNVDNTSDANKPISTATQTALNAKQNTSEKNQPNGYVGLNGSSKIDSSYLPSYVDDVLEFADLSSFPLIGDAGVIYLAQDTNKIYRWSGVSYIEVSQGITDHTLLNNIGTNTHADIDSHIASTANPHSVTAGQVGLGNVDNTSDLNKPISTATQNALDLITDVNWTGDYNNGTTYAVGDGVMFNGASFRMINFIGAAGYPPPAYPGNWLQVTDYVSPNDIGLGNVDNTSDLDKPISNDTQDALDLKVDKAGDTMTGPLNVTDLSKNVQFSVSGLNSTSTIEIRSDNQTLQPSGDVILTTGDVQDSDYAGSIYLTGGENVDGNPANIILTAGQSVGTGANGSIILDSKNVVYLNQNATGSIDASSHRIQNVEDPQADQDAATRKWVDEMSAIDNVIFISPTANAAIADGSLNRPYATIAAALTVAVNNNVIALLPGTYAEPTVVIPSSLSYFSIQGFSAINTIVLNGMSYIAPASNIDVSFQKINIGILTLNASSAINGLVTLKQTVVEYNRQDTNNNVFSITTESTVTGGTIAGGSNNFSECLLTVSLDVNDGLVIFENTKFIANVEAYGTSLIRILDCELLGATEFVNGNTVLINSPSIEIDTASDALGNLTGNYTKILLANIPLTNITQSSATPGQIISWNGSAWVPTTASFSSAWGSITGTLSAQTDLQSALDDKVAKAGDTMTGTLDFDFSAGPITSTITIADDNIVIAYQDPSGPTDFTTDIIGGNVSTINNTTGANTSVDPGSIFLYDDGVGTAHIPTVDAEVTTKKYVDDQDALKEDVANKSTDGTLASNSNTLYPSEQAVKTYVDNLSFNVNQVYLDTKEPTGFVNRNHSTISFDDASRTFTIQPTSGSFDVYIRGTKYIKTVAENTVISTTNGNHYIYYNASGALTSTTIFTSDIIEQYAFVAIVYWNSDTGTHTYFAEERHGITMDGATHSYLHTIFGARYLTGLALQGFTVDGAGNLNTEAQFTADGGNIRDEDILHELPPQTQIPIYYRQGQLWRRKTPDSYPVIYSGTAGYTGASGRIPYNEYVAGTWQLTQVTNNDFVLVHFFATNDVDDHIIGIQGTNLYGNVTAARVAAASEISSLSGLPFAEFVALGSVVFQSSNSFTNAPKCIVRSVNGGDYVDFRGTQLYTPAGTATTHGLLSGLSNDDHAQYHTDARGDARYQLKSAGDISETSFLLTNNQAVAANITGLAFNNAVTRSFTALISIYINATSSLYEQITIEGIQKGSSWDISVSNVGDNSGISFSITNAGQIQYTSINYTGFVSGVIKFRAITTSV
jgi:hypothetical protein